jgi:MFS family permease
MYAMAGVGTGVGPIVARRLTGDDPAKLRRMIIVGYLSAAVGLAIIAPLASFAVVLVGIFIRGFGNGVNWVFSTQLLMMQVPNDVRGRVFSTEFAAFTLAQAVGTAIGGWAIDFAGFGLSQIVITLTMLPLIPARSGCGGSGAIRWDRRPLRDGRRLRRLVGAEIGSGVPRHAVPIVGRGLVRASGIDGHRARREMQIQPQPVDEDRRLVTRHDLQIVIPHPPGGAW